MANGVITRKDIIEEDVLRIGPDYAKSMQPAIEANMQLVASLKEMAPLINTFRKADSQQAYIEAKQKENIITLQAINNNKLLEASELSLEKIKQAKLKTLKEELAVQAKEETAKKRNTQLTLEERVQNEINNRILKQEARERLGLVGAYEKLNKARTEAKNRLRDLIAAESSSTAEIKKAQKEYDVLNKKVIAADHAVDDFTKNVGNYPLQNVTSGLKNLISAFGVTGGIALFAGIMKGAYDTIKKFEQGVADLSAITGATGDDLKYLREQAILLGRDTQGGATAVVEAYKLIASAKPELLENVKSLNQVTEAVLLLSKAAGMEMPDAATALTDAMNQFGADASRAGVFVDTLANGAKYGAAEIPQVTEALLKFGAVARSTNVSIGESTALIELLAENGLKGADAGTALRNVMLKISAPDALPLKAKEALQSLGISFDMLKDRSVPFQQKLEALRPLLNDNAKMVKIFGLENVVAAQNIIGHTDRLKELTSKMGEAGTATEQANTRMDTLEGSIIKLESAYDSFILSLNDRNGLGSALKWVTDELTSTVEGWRRIFTSNEKLKEEELAVIRKAGFDSISKSYSDQNKFNEDQLKTIKSINSREIAENTAKVNALIADNERLSKNRVFLTGAIKNDSFAKIIENRKKVAELNKSTNSLLGKNEGINSLLESRKITPVTPTTKTNNNGDEETEKELKARLAREKKARQDYLTFLKKSEEDAYNLEKFGLERIIELDQETVDNDKKTAEQRINALLEIEQARTALSDTNLKHELVNNALSKIDADTTSQAKMDAIKREAELKADSLSRGVKLSENATDAEKLIYEKFLKEREDIERKSQENRQRLIDAQVSKLQKDLDNNLQGQDTELQKALEAENIKFKVLTDGQANIKDAVEDHERQVFEIKQLYAKKALQTQIDAIQNLLTAQDELPKEEQISADKRAKIENDLSKYKQQLSQINLEYYKGDAEKRVELEKEAAERTKELAMSLKDALLDLTNSIFDARIQNIDNEITASNDYYDKQMELAGNDERQKSLLEKERAKKEKALQKEKQKEIVKQAIFNKTIAIAEIGLNLAKTLSTISLAASELDAISFGTAGTPYRAIQIPLAIGLAAAQSAVVLATPIPKYKMGRKGGPAEIAEVGDGYVNEVISRPDGSGARLTPNKPTLTYLQKDDVVHKSVADYNEYMRLAMLKGFYKERERAGSYQYINALNQVDNTKELQEIKEAIKKQKTQVHVHNTIDFGHQDYRRSKINWRA